MIKTVFCSFCKLRISVLYVLRIGWNFGFLCFVDLDFLGLEQGRCVCGLCGFHSRAQLGLLGPGGTGEEGCSHSRVNRNAAYRTHAARSGLFFLQVLLTDAGLVGGVFTSRKEHQPRLTSTPLPPPPGPWAVSPVPGSGVTSGRQGLSLKFYVIRFTNRTRRPRQETKSRSTARKSLLGPGVAYSPWPR